MASARRFERREACLRLAWGRVSANRRCVNPALRSRGRLSRDDARFAADRAAKRVLPRHAAVEVECLARLTEDVGVGSQHAIGHGRGRVAWARDAAGSLRGSPARGPRPRRRASGPATLPCCTPASVAKAAAATRRAAGGNRRNSIHTHTAATLSSGTAGNSSRKSPPSKKAKTA